MTALPPDAVADLYKLVSELEQRLESSFAAHDAEIERGAATAAENTRLRNELGIAREQQAASADILGTIANATGDAAASLQRIAEITAHLFDAASVSIRIAEGNEWGLSIRIGAGPEQIAAEVPEEQRRAGSRNLPGTVFRENRQIHIPDLDNIDPAMADWPVMKARSAGVRTVAGTPLRRDGKAIGALIVYRERLAPFTDDELALQQSFADQAVIAIENARLFNETRQALERQTATADILKVIASSPSNAQPVFEAIAESAKRLLGAFSALVTRREGDHLYLAAATEGTKEGREVLRRIYPMAVSSGSLHAKAARTAATTISADTETDPNVAPEVKELGRARGFRSVVVVPLLRDGISIGTIGVSRSQPGRFEDGQVELLKTFADQAVIAIDNARLFNETQEALERQTATADILKVIASSPSDVQPVFDAIALSAKRLLTGVSAAMFRYIDGSVHLAAFTPVEPAADAALKADFPAPVEEFVAFRLARDGQPFAIPDTEELSHTPVVEIARKHGFRSMLWVPMVSGGIPIGLLSVTRAEPGAFASHHTQLLQTFADQAVIAIENVRLFNEVQQRTEDLSESLQQQTAVGDVLKTISRSTFDLQPVLDTLVNTAALLCDAEMAFLMRREGELYRAGAAVGFNEEYVEFLRNNPLKVDRGSITGRAVLERRTVQILDVATDPEYTLRESTTLARQHTALCVPLLRENEPIGTIVLARQRVEAFTQKQIELVTTFADQAVIAIENVRLFDEVRQRTDDLTEALTYQTGSANILKVIASSPTDVGPVLKAIVESACELCEANDAIAFLRDGESLRQGAHHGPIPVVLENRLISRDYVSGRSVVDKAPIHLHDVFSEEGAEFPEAQELSRTNGIRTILAVPLLSENECIGAILLRRTEVEPFNQKQIALLQTFADQAVIAIGNVRLFEEVQAKTHDLTEALTYQTGSANILRVIASSPTDVTPVLQAIVESACQLCGAYDALVRLKQGDGLAFGAHHGPLPVSLDSVPITENSTAGRAVIGQKPVHVHDLFSPEGDSFPVARALAREHGERTILSVPLLRENESIGAIVLRRAEVHPFSDKQIALLQTFADQAVIAIGNVRLFDEVQAKTRDLTEALTYQTGSGNILRVIASSPTDVKPVLKAIVESACELCEADDALAALKDGDELVFQAQHGSIPVVWDRQPIDRDGVAGLAVIDRKAMHVHDLLAPEGDQFPRAIEFARKTGVRTVLCVPLLREGESIGIIILRRTEVRPFSDKQITLLQTFADQAVIAIGNVRLFEEVQARTRDLTETLEQQTATADVLKVISRSPDSLQPVLDAIVETSRELCHSDASTIFLVRDNRFHVAAVSGVIPTHLEFLRANPMALDERGSILARVVRERRTLHYQNVADDPELSQGTTGLGGPRALVTVPLIRDGDVIGAMTLRQSHLKPFTARQIEAIETFADQAVIAISNVGLFEEVQARTRDLTESLQQQTATSEVLKVISSSPGELEPVFRSMLENAVSICDAKFGNLLLIEGGRAHWEAGVGTPPKLAEFFTQSAWFDPTPGSHVDRVMRTKQVSHTADDLAEPVVGAAARFGGARSTVCVPMVKDDTLLGTIFIYRTEVRPFTDKQIDLVKNFAAQAVIAIENTRLLKELRQRTNDLTESLEQQTATSEVLSVISRSAGDLEPVFQSMLENATRICGAQFGLMNLYEDGSFHTVGFHNVPPEFAAARAKSFRPHPVTALAQMVQTKKFAHIDDLRSSPPYLLGDPATLQLADMAGARTVVIVPMIKDDEFIGTIGIYRLEVLPFNEKQVALLSSFASQAVIAIENTRLLRELRQRTDDLTKSLDDLRTAQGRLVQTEKLASLGQLTAGIAHEIKNPLNFVNNFAALSAELTDELNDVLKQVEITGKIRGEVDEITGLLKDNLQKVVQHGKRADSIVKNMLLHSREGSGEHRPTDINALVDESLNLAYHGARAEKPDFNVTLQRDFDADAGMIEVFPQEITRVFLNLVSNGFYAVTRRKAESSEGGFDPVLLAATRNLGDAVEIRIRDNGTGIPQDVRDKMFNPFFTTKPAGEGTGLGLSMSHDIIVKQHGGTIDVDTEPGQFTEFRIVLPRTSKSSK